MTVTKVQGDPFAPPSIVEAVVRGVDVKQALDPIPVSDYLHRKLTKILARESLKGVGEGSSGRLSIPPPSPIIIPRSAVESRRSGEGWTILFRIWVGLPSRRRRVLAKEAEELLLKRVPRAVKSALKHLLDNLLLEHERVWREQEFIRKELSRRGLIAFIGDGSILPRKCGGCWEPLDSAVPFESPSSLRIEIELPTGRTVSGMAIPRGVSTITGPAFHGKTTLAEAVAHGVWNHVPGDGRELVVSDENLVYVESENGRWVSCVDVSPFIEYVPGGDVECFTTSDASGATSIAAAIQEYSEVGASGFILDEDLTATNMIHRDVWAEEVTGKRTINPLSDMAGEMASSGLSMVIVASGALPLLASSNRIIVMDEYRSVDATYKRLDAEKALGIIGYRRVAKKYLRQKPRRVKQHLAVEKPRVRGFAIESKSLRDTVDLRPLRQASEPQQLETAARAAAAIARRGGSVIADEARRISEMLRRWDYSFLPGPPGPGLSYVRPFEIAFILNRLPGLKACHTRFC